MNALLTTNIIKISLSMMMQQIADLYTVAYDTIGVVKSIQHLIFRLGIQTKVQLGPSQNLLKPFENKEYQLERKYFSRETYWLLLSHYYSCSGRNLGFVRPSKTQNLFTFSHNFFQPLTSWMSFLLYEYYLTTYFSEFKVCPTF